MSDSAHSDDASTGDVPACDGCMLSRRAMLHTGARTVGALGAVAFALGVPVTIASALTSARRGVRYPIPATDGVVIDRKNEVMLCRSGGSVYAFALACPHENTALRAVGSTGGFQCPKHKSRYQPNGTFISGRATRNMDRLPITRDADGVVVDVDFAIRSDKDATRWNAAVVSVA